MALRYQDRHILSKELDEKIKLELVNALIIQPTYLLQYTWTGAFENMI